MKSGRAVPGLLIVVSLTLQGIATTRLLCPPRAIAALDPIRIACPPALWPFTDYPMFSQPHRRGDSLAWIEARLEVPGRESKSLGLYEVTRDGAGESWDAAFEREERETLVELQTVIRSYQRSAQVAFERNRLVLTERGLVAAEQEESGSGSR